MHTFENALVWSLLPSSSESKGPFMAGKAKNMPQKCTFLGGRGKWSEGHGPTLGGAKFFETSFPHFKTYFIQIGCCHPYLIKCLIPIITLSSMFSFQNASPIKRKAVYTLLLFHIFIKILFNFWDMLCSLRAALFQLTGYQKSQKKKFKNVISFKFGKTSHMDYKGLQGTYLIDALVQHRGQWS